MEWERKWFYIVILISGNIKEDRGVEGKMVLLSEIWLDLFMSIREMFFLMGFLKSKWNFVGGFKIWNSKVEKWFNIFFY